MTLHRFITAIATTASQHEYSRYGGGFWWLPGTVAAAMHETSKPRCSSTTDLYTGTPPKTAPPLTRINLLRI